MAARPVRRILAALALTALLGLALAGGAGADRGRIGATFGLLVQDIADAFPPVEGLVASVQGEQIFFVLNARDGVQAGQELTVFRKGEVFRHPMSQRAMGRFEDILG